ncbi:MAG: Ig-like domain-containing protein [Ignavibacteriota bacterium]
MLATWFGTFTQAGSSLGFLYREGAFSPIEVPGAAYTSASGIDNAGRIVGFYRLGSNDGFHGFLYAGGSYSTVDAPGALSTQVRATNDRGQIVGTFTDAHGQHGFVDLGGTFTTLDAPGAVSTAATGINTDGEIVGTYTDSGSRVHGFLYVDGTFSTLDTPGSKQPQSLGINNAGQIVGLPGFLYHDGSFAAIDLAGVHTAIDDAGRIAGAYSDTNGRSHGFVAMPAASSLVAVSRGTRPESPVPSATTSPKASLGPSPCDANGNSVTDVSDVQQMILEALGRNTASNDLNSDRVVNVVDVQVVMNAVLRSVCITSGGQQGGGGTVAHLTVQSGNGQVLCILPSCTLQFWQPLSVKATDASGNPVSGATVNWNVTSGQVMLGTAPGTRNATSVTDANGLATQSLTELIYSWQAQPFNSFVTETIQATCNNQTATFTTIRDLQNSSGSSEIQANPPQFNGFPLGDNPLSAPLGTTLTTPIQERVSGLDLASNGVPNVSVRIINQQVSPTLTCNTAPNADPGSVLTDAQGNASCYPTFNGIGSGQYFLVIGGVAGGTVGNGALYMAALGPLNFSSTTSVGNGSGSVQIVSGDNQTAPVNQPLSPLVVKLVDGQGNIVIGQTMVWSVAPAFAATLPFGAPQTDGNGEVHSRRRDPQFRVLVRLHDHGRGAKHSQLIGHLPRQPPEVIGKAGPREGPRASDQNRLVAQTLCRAGRVFVSPESDCNRDVA